MKGGGSGDLRPGSGNWQGRVGRHRGQDVGGAAHRAVQGRHLARGKAGEHKGEPIVECHAGAQRRSGRTDRLSRRGAEDNEEGKL